MLREFPLLLRHLSAKWFRFPHFQQVFPNAGHDSLSRVSCCLPQLGQCCMFHCDDVPTLVLCFCTWLGGVVTVLMLAPWPSSTSFSWDTVLSAERQISSVRFSVSAGSLNRRSLVLLSRTPNTRRSRRSSSGVIDPKSQFAASFRSAVRYWS